MFEEKGLNVTRGAPPAYGVPLDLIADAAGDAIRKHGAKKLAGYYGGPLGHTDTREYFAGREGVPIENIMLSRGGMEALYWTLLAAVRRKNYETFHASGTFETPPTITVGVPHITYDRALFVIAQINHVYTRLGHTRIKVVIIPEGPDGPDLDHLRNVAHQLDYYYVIPTFSNPLGAVWSLEKRRAVLEIAQQFVITLLEDSPYEQLWYGEAPPPQRLFELSGKNPELVVSMNSLTKIINCGELRACYSMVPDWVTDFMLNSKNSPAKLFISQPGLGLTVMEPLFRHGIIDSHSKFIRGRLGPIVQEIARLFSEYLGEFVQLHAIPQGGYFFWATILLASWDAGQLRKLAAANANLELQVGKGFYTDPNTPGSDKTFRIAAPPLETVEDVRSFVQRLRYIFTGEVVDIK